MRFYVSIETYWISNHLKLQFVYLLLKSTSTKYRIPFPLLLFYFIDFFFNLRFPISIKWWIQMETAATPSKNIIIHIFVASGGCKS